MTIRLPPTNFYGNDIVALTPTQIKKMNRNKRIDFKLSKAQIMSKEMKGSNIVTSIASNVLPLATNALPNVAKNVLPGLAHGVSSALASLGINTLFGGSILMQPEMIEYFSPFNIWTPQQLNDMNNAYNPGSPLQMRLTKEQEGGFLGALAASIGILMLINAFTGKGVRITKGDGLRVLSPGIVNPVSYDQMATSQIKKEGHGLFLGKNSPFNNIPLLGTFL